MLTTLPQSVLTGPGSVINGGPDTPDFEENERPSSQHAHRAHLRTDSRSHSPAANFARGEISQLSQSIATLNGRSSSPPPLPARFGSSAGTKDSFLNYFFGKDGTSAQSTTTVPRTAPSEANFAQGFRRNMESRDIPINGLTSPTFETSRLSKEYQDYTEVCRLLVGILSLVANYLF